MTFNVSLIMTLFPLIVIQSFGKNTLRERWKPAMCHKAKNLLLWMTFYRLPYHGYKSSHSFRMTFNGQRSYPLFSKLAADSSQLLAFILIPAFLTTVIDPSHSFRMTINVSRIMTFSVPHC